MVWHIVFIIVFLALLLLIGLRLIIWRRTKIKSLANTHNNHEFYYDDLIKTDSTIRNKGKKQRNYVFETNYKNGEIVTKYIISEVKKSKTIILEHKEELKEVSYQIFCYDKNVRLIEVLDLYFNEVPKHTKSLDLPKKTEYINLVETNKGIDNSHNYKVTYPTLLLLLDSTIMLTFIYSLSFVVGLLLFGNEIVTYFESSNAFILLAFAIVFIAVNFSVIKFIYNKRSQGLIKEELLWKITN